MPGGTSVSASTQATGTAGGGNVFNSAPLFGSQIGNTMGSAGQSPAGSAVSALSNPFVLGGLILLGLGAIVAFVVTRK